MATGIGSDIESSLVTRPRPAFSSQRPVFAQPTTKFGERYQVTGYPLEGVQGKGTGESSIPRESGPNPYPRPDIEAHPYPWTLPCRWRLPAATQTKVQPYTRRRMIDGELYTREWKRGNIKAQCMIHECTKTFHPFSGNPKPTSPRIAVDLYLGVEGRDLDADID